LVAKVPRRKGRPGGLPYSTRRAFLGGALAALLPPPVFGADASWVASTFRELHLDAHFSQIAAPYENFDAERAADLLKAAGFQMVSFFAVCNAGYSYFPTRLGVVHPGLKRDYTGEMARALKKRGIRVMAYVSAGPERKLHKEHPEWVIVRNPPAAGRADMAQMCLNSPWVDEAHIPRMREIADLYGVDGFFLDNLLGKFVGTACYCRTCRERFAADIGGEIPTSDADPKVFAHHRWLTRNMGRYAEKVTAAFPGRAFVFTHLWVTRTPVTPPAAVKQVVWEPVPPYPGIHSIDFSLESRYLSTLRGVENFSCMATRGNGWGDYSLRDAAIFRHEAAVMLANGGRPYLSDDNYPSGNPDPAVYQVYGEVNRRTAELEGLVKGCVPVKDVAVLLSADSMWSGLPLVPAREWMSAPASPGVAGAHRALVEDHTQFSILNSETLVETLGEYGALILPEQRVLSDRECDAVRRFVERGGALIVTGDTGTRDGENRPRKDLALADVLGVSLAADFSEPAAGARTYLRTGEMDVQIRAGHVRIRTTSARTLMPLAAVGEKQAPLAGTDGPGVTMNNFGKGRALYCAAPLYTAYYREGTGALRRLASRMLDTVHPRTARIVALEDAPLNVEVICNARGRDRIVHLLSYSYDRRIDFGAIHGVRVGIRCASRPRRVQPGTVEWKDGWAWVAAQPFSTHATYVFEGT
jgi:hypothetical protein